jgi:simple sugar transport system permease protein
VLLLATGHDPVRVYRDVLTSNFGSWLAFSQTLIATTPLLLTALAAVVAHRMRIWTIGADGQLIVGAIFASGFALVLGQGAPAPVLVLGTMAAGVVGGALWAGIAGAVRAYLRTDEVIATLMLNFVAIKLMNYLVFGTGTIWGTTSGPVPSGAPLPQGSRLPHLFDQADVGILVAVAVAVLVWLALRFTVWGFEVDLIGDSPRAARYAGVDVRAMILVVLVISGALAGLAGAIQVANVTQALEPKGIDPGLGLGYSGIVVAALARLNPLAVVPVALLMATLLNAGPSVELSGVPAEIVIVLQGLVLLLVAAGQFLLSYRIRRPSPRGAS